MSGFARIWNTSDGGVRSLTSAFLRERFRWKRGAASVIRRQTLQRRDAETPRKSGKTCPSAEQSGRNGDDHPFIRDNSPRINRGRAPGLHESAECRRPVGQGLHKFAIFLQAFAHSLTAQMLFCAQSQNADDMTI